MSAASTRVALCDWCKQTTEVHHDIWVDSWYCVPCWTQYYGSAPTNATTVAPQAPAVEVGAAAADVWLSGALGQLDLSDPALSGPDPSTMPPPPPRLLGARPSLLAPPRPKHLLVLDANGFLCWRSRRSGKDVLLPSRAPDLSSGNYHVYARPHVRDFLRWCAQRFHVVMWSTALRENIEPIIAAAFGDDGSLAPAAIFDQSDCTDTGVGHPDNKHKPMLIKRLSVLWADQRLAAGVPGVAFGPSNTLLIDDSPYKAIDNPKHTAVHPREWSALDDDDAHTAALAPDGEVRRLLALVAAASDVRTPVGALFAAGTKAPAGFWQEPDPDPVLHMLHEQRRDL